MQNKVYEGVNWNKQGKDYTTLFWEQNIKQFWIDTEYIPSKDIDSWRSLSPEMQNAYMKVLGGLTMLDTLQSNTGMTSVIPFIDDLQQQAVLSYMCMMEAIHAKSYSTIFTTVASAEQIDSTFEWIKNNKYLQYKASRIDEFYQGVVKGDKISLYKGLSASVLLESFLFYSGFFLPLWLSGQGKMVACSDIIKKIVQDESIHGVFVGLLAQDLYEAFTPEEQKEVKDHLYTLLQELYDNECKYAEEVYGSINLTSEVKLYIKYNANKALMNLGFEELYPGLKINQMVLNGLSDKTTQHDFFSKKSTNYEKATEIVPLTSEDFDISNL